MSPALRPQTVIADKRDGRSLSTAAIDATVAALCEGQIGPEQIGAFLMACYLRGLDDRETRDLTLAMARSGARLAWDRADLRGPVVDKHSNGGVGDVVSLVLAPMLAACDCHVPMISGHALGPMGGTLDKLESVPGLSTALTLERMQAQVRREGLAIGAATDALVPADRILYDARDVTATVTSLPLIVASILSKKLAEGLDALALDVKHGSGAVFRQQADAATLAAALERVAMAAGLRCRVTLSPMAEPLVPVAGDALELAYAIAYLKGATRSERLHRLVLELGAGLLAAVGVPDAEVRLGRALADGSALERLAALVSAQGGPSELADDPWRILPAAPVRQTVTASRSGVVSAVDAGRIGRLVLGLGGGRAQVGDVVDHAVGVSDLVAVGDPVHARDPLGRVHARTPIEADDAAAALTAAVTIEDG
ncbi:MAG: thymidine phosphorylase [Pseudomonadota bacterium]